MFFLLLSHQFLKGELNQCEISTHLIFWEKNLILSWIFSAFQLEANETQYSVTPEIFRQVVGSPTMDTDRCTLARVNSLSYEKHHMPFCQVDKLKLVNTSDIQLLPPPENKVCQETPLQPNFNMTWPVSCHQIIYADEIPQPIECAKNNSGSKNAFGIIFTYLLLTSILLL